MSGFSPAQTGSLGPRSALSYSWVQRRGSNAHFLLSNQQLELAKLLRVLVVDDDDIVRFVTGTLLKRMGHVVHQACSGSEGLKVLAQRAHDVDILLLDLSMPGLTGYEVLETVKRNYPRLPVVISTGCQVTMNSFATEPDGLLRKPFQPQELREVIDHVLRRFPDLADRQRT